MKIADELKAWRGVEGSGKGARGKFSQTEAAARLGVPLKTYVCWEQGTRTPQGLSLQLVRLRIGPIAAAAGKRKKK